MNHARHQPPNRRRTSPSGRCWRLRRACREHVLADVVVPPGRNLRYGRAEMGMLTLRNPYGLIDYRALNHFPRLSFLDPPG